METTASALREQVATASDVVQLFGSLIKRAFKGHLRWREIMRQTVSIGVESLPIITIATAAAGVVTTNEIAWHMDLALHTVSMIPGFTGQFILRELGIVVPCLLLVAKVGAAITAEVGTMKVTEQIDALKLLKIDPVSYLVFPRFIASIIASSCLTLIASAVTLLCAVLAAVNRYHFSWLEYLNLVRHFVTYKDLLCALTKGTLYGSVIPVISCAYGFRCKGGAEGVGTATTNSVVASTITIIILDFLLTFLFAMVL